VSGAIVHSAAWLRLPCILPARHRDIRPAGMDPAAFRVGLVRLSTAWRLVHNPPSSRHAVESNGPSIGYAHSPTSGPQDELVRAPAAHADLAQPLLTPSGSRPGRVAGLPPRLGKASDRFQALTWPLRCGDRGQGQGGDHMAPARVVALGPLAAPDPVDPGPSRGLRNRQDTSAGSGSGGGCRCSPDAGGTAGLSAGLDAPPGAGITTSRRRAGVRAAAADGLLGPGRTPTR